MQEQGKGLHLEGALHSLVLAHVQGLDQLLDLVLGAPVLGLPPGQLLPLLREVAVRRVLSWLQAPAQAAIADGRSCYGRC